MATFISLVNWTDQGIRNVKESPDRYEAFKAVAEKAGVKVKGFYYTMGRYDMVLITEASDEAARRLRGLPIARWAQAGVERFEVVLRVRAGSEAAG